MNNYTIEDIKPVGVKAKYLKTARTSKWNKVVNIINVKLKRKSDNVIEVLKVCYDTDSDYKIEWKEAKKEIERMVLNYPDYLIEKILNFNDECINKCVFMYNTGNIKEAESQLVMYYGVAIDIGLDSKSRMSVLLKTLDNGEIDWDSKDYTIQVYDLMKFLRKIVQKKQGIITSLRNKNTKDLVNESFTYLPSISNKLYSNPMVTEILNEEREYMNFDAVLRVIYNIVMAEKAIRAKRTIFEGELLNVDIAIDYLDKIVKDENNRDIMKMLVKDLRLSASVRDAMVINKKALFVLRRDKSFFGMEQCEVEDTAKSDKVYKVTDMEYYLEYLHYYGDIINGYVSTIIRELDLKFKDK